MSSIRKAMQTFAITVLLCAACAFIAATTHAETSSRSHSERHIERENYRDHYRDKEFPHIHAKRDEYHAPEHLYGDGTRFDHENYEAELRARYSDETLDSEDE